MSIVIIDRETHLKTITIIPSLRVPTFIATTGLVTRLRTIITTMSLRGRMFINAIVRKGVPAEINLPLKTKCGDKSYTAKELLRPVKKLKEAMLKALEAD